jgi:hypothetical protein
MKNAGMNTNRACAYHPDIRGYYRDSEYDTCS